MPARPDRRGDLVAAPRNKDEFLDALRGALDRAPRPLPEIPGVPLLGGLVGYTAYDAVRYFEPRAGPQPG